MGLGLLPIVYYLLPLHRSLTADTARHRHDRQRRIAKTELQYEFDIEPPSSPPAPGRRGTAVANGNDGPPLYDEELMM